MAFNLTNSFNNLFGFRIRKTEKEKEIDQNNTHIVPPKNEDSASIIDNGLGTNGYGLNFDGIIQSEFDLINKYREMSFLPDVSRGIDETINEMVISSDDEESIKIDLDKVPVKDEIKKDINKAFEKIKDLLNWEQDAYDIASRWFIDGRSYYYVVLDEKNIEKGILDLRYIDPRLIKLVQQRSEEIDPETNQKIYKIINEYYVYDNENTTQQGKNVINPLITSALPFLYNGAKINKDSIVYIHSGKTDRYGKFIISNLHYALKISNQLKMMEDSLVIYRITRAPERRIFYIDTGNLPATKAKEYLEEAKNKFRSKMIYDINTGESKNEKNLLSMQEDIFIARSSSGQGSEIDTLKGGEHLDEIADIEYFRTKLYEAMKIPTTRLDPEKGASLGRSNEITRDEVKFSKYVTRLRRRLNTLFLKLMRIELIATKVLSAAEWNVIENKINFKYAKDNYFSELKDSEILGNRLDLLIKADQFEGKYYDKNWIKKNILKQTDEEIKNIEIDIKSDPTPTSQTEIENIDSEIVDNVDSATKITNII